MRRDVAEKMGLDIYEFNILGSRPENELKFDKEFDIYQQELDPNDDIIVDSRLWYHNIPSSFKIFLSIDQEEAAKRIFNNQRDSDNYHDIVKNLDIIRKRNDNDRARYEHLYNTNPWDLKNYDLVIDTSKLTIEEVLHRIFESLPRK